MLKRFYLSLFFSKRFFRLWAGVIGLFIVSYGLEFLFVPAELLALFLLVMTALDYMILFTRRTPVEVVREMSERFSIGDSNRVLLKLTNGYSFKVRLRIIDELPDQFQQREFSLYQVMEAGGQATLHYDLRPLERGEYVFHNINVFIKSPFGMLVRRKILNSERTVRVLPAYFHMRQFELQAWSSHLSEAGNKRVRKIGLSMEFEQIKEYVIGDDIRSLNWKATARKGGQLMVNKFTDEKSQQVYCIIDKGRIMKMPFDGMSLLDYAINATLMLSKVALIKQDKAGLLTFADQIGTFLPASRKALQMKNIQEILYNQQTKFLESDHEKLYAFVKARINQRSLVVLFTNFESLSGLQRQMPYIRGLAKNHLLLVVFFENTGLEELRNSQVKDLEELYIKTIAEKFAYEKRLIVKELNRHGIMTILTPPERLTVETVNKYLEIKARLAI